MKVNSQDISKYFRMIVAIDKNLQEREKKILIGRIKGKTLKELGEELGISPSFVQHLENRGMRVLFHGYRHYVEEGEKYFAYVKEKYNYTFPMWRKDKQFLKVKRAVQLELDIKCGSDFQFRHILGLVKVFIKGMEAHVESAHKGNKFIYKIHTKNDGNIETIKE